MENMSMSEWRIGRTRCGTAYTLEAKKAYDDWYDKRQQALAAVPVPVPTSTFGCYAGQPMQMLADIAVAYFGKDVAHDIIPVAAHKYI
jgi:hypothetical protein